MIAKGLEETKKIAGNFAGSLTSGTSATIVGLRGDLGAGKTTFTQALLESFAVQEKVTSPTFVIMKTYDIVDKRFKRLIHIDAYRLENGHDLEVLGWQTLIADSANLIVIEWPEKVKDVLPESTRYIDFTFVSENKRDITIHDKKE